MVNPTIYVSCIKQFWASVTIKKVNDVVKLRALIDGKRVVVTEDVIRQALHLDDADGVECLPNEDIFTELARKGFFGVKTPLFERMLVGQEIEEEGDEDEHVEDVTAGDDAYGDATAVQPPPQPQPQPQQAADFPMSLLQKALDAYAALTKRVENLKYDKVAQALEITKLKRRVKKLEKRNKGRMIAEMDTDDVVVLMDDKEEDKKVKEAKVVESAQVQGRQAESQAEIYKINMDHANKVLSMQEDETKPAKVQEVVDVVTTAKLITEVVTAASETVTTASAIIPTAEPQVPAATLTVAPEKVAIATSRRRKGVVIRNSEEEGAQTSQEEATVVTAASKTIITTSITITAAEAQVPAATLTAAPARVTAAPSRRRKGVVIRDLQEEYTTSIIILAETKSMDKGKGILVEEPEPLKKKQQIKQDEKYARELEAELNKNIDWDEAFDHVKKKAKEDPAVKRYQMDYFKEMSYDDIRYIFEAKFNTNVAFLPKSKEQIKEEESRALKRLNETPAEKAAKGKKATPLARKVPVVDYKIIELNNKPYYKIIRADARYSCSNMEESKKCTWSSKCQRMETVVIMWCADHYIYNHTADFVSREEVPTHKIHSRSDAEC
nr:hypothetical protein [Tanacetum cinerariifolium]